MRVKIRQREESSGYQPRVLSITTKHFVLFLFLLELGLLENTVASQGILGLHLYYLTCCGYIFFFIPCVR